MDSLRRNRVLVTGGAGFIASRLIERLVSQFDVEVVALVHSLCKSSRIARFPISIVSGDVTNLGSLREIARGCDAIVHCAVSFAGTNTENRRVTVEGAKNVCKIACAERMKLVHLSTFSVYGVTQSGKVNESALRNPRKDPYGTSKLEAEQIIQRAQQSGLNATILQPTIVYGPWSFWSNYAIQQLNNGGVLLPDLVNAKCNAVYIDDVVDAIILSLNHDEAKNGPYLISGPEPILWKEYYEGHVGPLEKCRITDKQEVPTAERLSKLTLEVINQFRQMLNGMTSPDARRYLKLFILEMLQHFKLYSLKVSNVSGGKVLCISEPAPAHIELLKSRTEISIEKAKNELGYAPKFGFEEGSKITVEWASWANLYS